MTDVHSHILPFVDDGSNSIDKSLEIIKILIKQGVNKIFLTPHHKLGEYEKTVQEIKREFDEFNKIVKDTGLEVELYLGQEIYCSSNTYNLLKDGKLLTLNDSKYILIEFDYYNYTEISDYVYNLKSLGYFPIIAHIERYTYLDESTLFDLKNQGALIQVNASTIVGKRTRSNQKKVLNYIERGYVDFVSTDIHSGRECCIEKAYNLVKKKFGVAVAEKLFEENAKILY